uniref:Glycoside hydrolase family 76 protein n=1 Tax=Mycena chlorophos TaxID=658473 RepID=A0ABQ0M3A9_MYCCL|nr:glycoside hydrolase family 76 protein [Mycena chlorophos]
MSSTLYCTLGNRPQLCCSRLVPSSFSSAASPAACAYSCLVHNADTSNVVLTKMPLSFPHFVCWSLLVVSTGFPAHVSSQIVSPLWRDPNITTTTPYSVSLASSALQETTSQLGSNGFFDGADYLIPAIFFSQLAAFDFATNQTQYQTSLTQYFATANQTSTDFSDSNIYGYAAAQAYIAYKDPLFLKYAELAWETGNNYTIAQSDVNAGRMVNGVKSFSLAQMCQGATMAGGTFSSTNATDTSINGLPTGHFAILSALLAQTTNDSRYLPAAQLSVTFMQNHWLDSDDIVLDGISGNAGADECMLSDIVEPYDSGMMIEALAVLVQMTGQEDLQALLVTVVHAAIVSDNWQGTNGIISNQGHGGGGDLFLVRGLIAAYARNIIGGSLSDYVLAYLAVQYNAVLDLARSSQASSIYGLWVGPAAQSFDPTDQTAALGVLVAGILLRNQSSVSASSAGSTPNAGSTSATAASSETAGSHSNTPAFNQSPRGSHIAAIAGGAVGVVASVIFCAAFWIQRRRRNRRANEIGRERYSTPGGVGRPGILVNSSGDPSTWISPFTDAYSSPPSGHPSSGDSASPFSSKMREKCAPLSRPVSARSTSNDAAPSNDASEALPTQLPTAPSLLATAGLPLANLIQLLQSRLQGEASSREMAWTATEEDLPEEAPPRYPGTRL